MGREMAKHNIPYVNLPAQGRDQMEDLKKIFAYLTTVPAKGAKSKNQLNAAAAGS